MTKDPTKKKKKTQASGHINSPVRKKRIQKGRMIWKTLAGTSNEKLHEFFKYCYAIDDGYSKLELMVIIYEKELGLDHKLGLKKFKTNLTDADKYKILKFRKYTEVLLTQFRTWLENESLVLIAEKNSTGEMIFYNIMKTTSWQEYERQRKRAEEAMRNKRERMEEVFKQGKKTRMQKSEKLSAKIDLRNHRRNKKRSGDFGSGDGVN
jgi:hypothetical protein